MLSNSASKMQVRMKHKTHCGIQFLVQRKGSKSFLPSICPRVSHALVLQGQF